MMNNTTRRRLLREWRIKKVTMYIVSLAVLVIGSIIMVQEVFSDSLKDIRKPITGFIIFEFGFMLLMDTYSWKFKNYLSKKMKKAR